MFNFVKERNFSIIKRVLFMYDNTKTCIKSFLIVYKIIKILNYDYLFLSES